MDIKSLKDKILQLAIQGKLVTQNESDEPASLLLEKIKIEKEQLIKEKIIKKEKPLQKITDDEKLFELPSGWEWCRLNDVCVDFLVPQRDKPKKFDGNISWCRIEDIEGKFLNGTKSNQYVSQETVDKMNLKVNPIGTVICSCSASLGVQAIVTKPCCTNQTFIGLVPSNKLNNEYLYYFLMSQKKYFYEIGAGTTIPYISKKKFQELRITLPPLEEQKRIVDKVDELFELIDELDSNKKDLLENISNSRNKVLQLAIQGKLVEQYEDDEPTSILLEKIKNEKEQLIKDKVIKKEKQLPEITEEDKPFELPKGWEWCRLGEISNYIKAGGDKPKDFSTTKNEEYSIPVIANGKTNTGIVGYTKTATENNMCITVSGRGTIGYSCIRNEPFCPIVRLIVICPSLGIDINYLNCALHYFIEQGVGTSIQQLTVPMIKPKVIPLPPLEEQKRISAKVDLIMDYLDKLQQEIESQEIILEDIL